MKKIVKGSIAAAAAGVLLLGGFSTLSYWSDSGEIVGGEVTAGTLSLGTVECPPVWVYAAGNAAAGEPVDLIVPGDTISKDCTFVVNATGDNLEATLSIPATTLVTGTPAASLVANIAATYTTAGAPTGVTITEANDGNEVTAKITVAFPFGTDEDGAPMVNANDTRGILVQLDAIPITLIQTES